jgi:hypothetical protein
MLLAQSSGQRLREIMKFQRELLLESCDLLRHIRPTLALDEHHRPISRFIGRYLPAFHLDK